MVFPKDPVAYCILPLYLNLDFCEVEKFPNKGSEIANIGPIER
jgi:hypothetical protein